MIGLHLDRFDTTRFKRAAGVLISLGGVLATLLSLPWPVRLAILGGCVLIGLAVVLDGFRSAAADAAPRTAARELPALGGRWFVRTLDAQDLRAFFDLDREIYGNAVISIEHAREFLARWPFGLTGAFDSRDGALAGAIGIWPIDAATFASLCTGHRSDLEIVPADIAAPASDTHASHWIITTLMLRPRYRGAKGALPALLSRAFAHWSVATASHDEVSIVAIAESAEGERLLRHAGFRPGGRDARDRAIYLLGPMQSAHAHQLVRTLGLTS